MTRWLVAKEDIVEGMDGGGESVNHCRVSGLLEPGTGADALQLTLRFIATRERDSRTTSRPQGQEEKYRETGPCGIQVPLPRRAAE